MKKKQGSKAWLRLEVKKGLYGDAGTRWLSRRGKDAQELDAGRSGRRPQAGAGPGLLGRHRHESSGMTTNANEGRGRRAGP